MLKVNSQSLRIACQMPTSKQAENNFRLVANKRGWEVLSPYMGTLSKISMRCSIGHILDMRPHDFKNKRGCRFCSKTDKMIAELKFRLRIREIGGKVKGVYKNTQTEVSCICFHNHPCNPLPNNIIRGQGMCKVCARNDSETAEKEFRERCDKAGVIIKGDYINSATRIECVCPKDHICYPLPSSIQGGKEFCVECLRRQKGSRGERKVQRALEQLGVKYRKEFSLPTKRRRFDFELPDLKIIIEVDGDQHFKLCRFTSSEEDLEKSHKIDSQKMADAIIADYKVIRIDYKLYDQSVENFVEFLQPHLIPRTEGSPGIVLSNLEMYSWVYDYFPKEECGPYIIPLK